MKKKISLFLIYLILLACSSPKKIVSNQENCKAVIVPSEDLILNYSSLISSSDFNVKQFEDFNKAKDGILLYKWQEGSGSSSFLIVNYDEKFSAFSKSEKFSKEVNFSVQEKNDLKSIVQTLKKESYYQSCVIAEGHSSVYILVIRRNDENILQYYSPFISPYEINTSYDNIKSIQKILGIIDYK